MAVAVLFLAALFPQEEYENPEPFHDPVNSAGLYLRGLVSAGELTDNGLDHDDLFGNGFGFGLVYSRAARQDGDSELLGYLELGFDSFGGRSHTDVFGDRIKTDGMDQWTLIGGARTMTWFEDLWFHGNPILVDFRIGLGVVNYSRVEADFIVGGTPFPDQEFLRASTAAVFDTGVRMGMSSPSFSFHFGIGFRIQGGPRRGGDMSSLVNPSSRADFVMDLGYELRF